MKNAILLVLTVLSLALLQGCARNAVFEIEMQLPAAGERPIPTAPPITHVKIQIQPGPSVWGDLWAVTASETVGPIALTDSAQTIHIDVEGDGDHLNQPVDVRILYCSSESCGTTVSERWFEFEQAFYKGKSTNYRMAAELTTMGLENSDTEGTEPRLIEKCEVAGCVETNGEFLMDYCPSSGVHWCERE